MIPSLTNSELAQTIGLWVAAGITVAVLSYMVGDNALFRAMQYLFVGISAGYGAALAWSYVLAPRLQELIEAPRASWPYTLMLLLGVMLLARGWRPIAPLAELPLGLAVGVTAALAIGGILRGTLVPQAAATIVSVAPVDYGEGIRGWAFALDATLMLLATISVLAAYQYRVTGTGPVGLWLKAMHALGRVGRAFIVLVLAAMLAGAALSFYGALRGRIEFLLFDWLAGITGWGG